MERKNQRVGDCEVELLTRDDEFLGLGQIRIGETLVRSGRLPLSPWFQSFTGVELARLILDEVVAESEGLRLRLKARFRPLPVKLMRDHSFDPVYDTGDWDAEQSAGEGRLDLVLEPAADSFEGIEFNGFAYHYEYESAEVPLFYILDRASWELDGDITGATVISQSACSAPVAVFEAGTEWTTEGLIHWEDEHAKANPVMTHNLPRWASHQAFDCQYKERAALLGVFEGVSLIRSLLTREAGKPELKTFDKHIFDQALSCQTVAKKILLNTEKRSETGQRNLWSWVFDEVHRRARAEYGLQEEPLVPRLSMNYWDNFTIDSYYKDLLPAAQAIGIKSLFIDNVNKSAMTEPCGLGNMCCGHEYEPAPRLGGPKKLAAFVQRCAEHGIRLFSWTNNDQAYSSPINASERDEKGWFVRMEDTRIKYGGAYTNVMSILNFGKEEPRRYWIDCLKKIKETTGLGAYLFDSFYNLGFMPVDYSDSTPTTIWRGTLAALKELQDAGVHFMIESFGPFGEVQHGCPTSYNLDNLFACYKIGMGTGYTTVPTGQEKRRNEPWPVPLYYRILAHKARPDHSLFYEGERIDALFTQGHKQALKDYNENHQFMYRRFLQEDGQSVLWHDREGKAATLWNFAAREAELPGAVLDLSTGKELPRAHSYKLQESHTYRITAAEPLPTQT